MSFGGAKLLRVWGEIKGPMADYAGATFTTQQSLDILVFLLQQNGLPAGNKPLENTREPPTPFRKNSASFASRRKRIDERVLRVAGS
jgi:hypothetical protein